ncbi:MAG: SCO family protein [Hyphomicrobium sp.]|nr:SCO family protein [Hyphomicrobium sp.]
MSSKLFIALALGLFAGVVAAYVTLNIPAGPEGRAQTQTGRVAIGGPFSLVDTAGERRTEKDFSGKPMLVFFGFTNCPDVCPSGLQTLTVALDKLGDKAEGLTPLFITVDPERDTPQSLAAYMKSFHPRIQALTGTPDEVNAAIKAYRVYAVKVPDDTDPTRYNIDHSSFFYLMNSSGEYVKHFPHSTDATALADALAAAL